MPPFGGTAPPGPSVPGDGATGGEDCNSICNKCSAQVDSETIQECVAWCKELPGRCFSQITAVVRCYIGNGCEDQDNCDAEAVALARCVGPGDDDGGEGGQGGI